LIEIWEVPSGGGQKYRGSAPLALPGLGNASGCPATIIALMNSREPERHIINFIQSVRENEEGYVLKQKHGLVCPAVSDMRP
jgi:hypothetical protein